MKNSYIQGVTLIELMIGLVVGSILMVLAVPSFQGIIENNRATAMANDFLAGLQLARTEAIKRGTSVSFCPASDNTLTACGDETNWGNGWIVFVDENGNGTIENQNELVKVYDKGPSDTVVETTDPVVTFESSGGAGVGSKQFLMYSGGECSANNARVLSIRPNGHSKIKSATCAGN